MDGLKSLLVSRKFWLAVAAIGVAVAVNCFGASEIAAAEIADKVVAIILVLAALIAGEDIAEKIGNGK